MASSKSPDSFTFTVGKLDAGMAILLGERAHLIEFPSILLPPGATTGSIVNIAVHQNHAEEKKRETEFWDLQEDILKEYGERSPEPPKLSVRNVTQTSVTLEWSPLKLATAKLRSLDIYRNGERLSAVPAPMTNTSTKHSGMEINTEYSFQLILRTTAGTFPSNVLRVRTHTMQDTSGICVCFGNVQDSVLLENAKMALDEMGAKWTDKVEIDTSHFVCTTPAATPSGASPAGNSTGSPGVQYQRALQLSIPVVQPYWILACHSERRMVPIASFYLGANTATPATASFNRPLSMSQASLPSPGGTPISGTSAKATPASYRASMPAPSRVPTTPQSSFVNQPTSANESNRPRQFGPTVEEAEDDPNTQTVTLENSPGPTVTSKSERRKSKPGSMNREFKFPPPSPTIPSTPSSAAVTAASQPQTPKANEASTSPAGKSGTVGAPPSVPTIQVEEDGEEDVKPGAVTPSAIEVPAPPPVEKERSISSMTEDSTEDELGDTVDIPLN